MIYATRLSNSLENLTVTRKIYNMSLCMKGRREKNERNFLYYLLKKRVIAKLLAEFLAEIEGVQPFLVSLPLYQNGQLIIKLAKSAISFVQRSQYVDNGTRFYVVSASAATPMAINIPLTVAPCCISISL